MMSDQNQGYGEPHIQFGQALVQLARDHGVRNFQGSFRLSWNHDDRPGWTGDTIGISWAEGRHGDDSNIVLRCEQTAVIPEIAPNTASIPPLTYASEGNFYEVGSRKGKGQKFYERWRERIADFPATREEALDRAGPDTRAYIERKYP